jgi:hypothetical protein
MRDRLLWICVDLCGKLQVGSQDIREWIRRRVGSRAERVYVSCLVTRFVFTSPYDEPIEITDTQASWLADELANYRRPDAGFAAETIGTGVGGIVDVRRLGL